MFLSHLSTSLAIFFQDSYLNVSVLRFITSNSARFLAELAYLPLSAFQGYFQGCK